MGMELDNHDLLKIRDRLRLGSYIAGLIAVVILLWIFFPKATVYGFRGQTATHLKYGYLSREPAPPATIRQQVAQDLSIQKSHSGNFLIGQTGSYLITVSNVGTGTVSGQVTVTDVLPTGLVPISSSGGGWTPCGFTGQTVVCVNPNASGLASGESFPAISMRSSSVIRRVLCG